MSIARMLANTSRLLKNRWQIPLAFAAVAVGGTALYRLIPSSPPPDLDALLADVRVLEQAGDTLAATDAVANLLQANLEPPLSPAQQALLHSRMADLIYGAERSTDTHNTSNVKKLLEHSAAARDLGAAETGSTLLRAALAHQWLGEEDAAVRGFRACLEEELNRRDRRTALRGLVELLIRRPEANLERRQVLDRLLADEDVAPAQLWWALHHAVEDALGDQDTRRAHELLEAHSDRLKTSDLKGYLDFLRACIMLREGRLEEAAPLARWVDEWLQQDDRTTRELDSFGHLPTLNSLLMGRIHLAEDRPQQALSAFEEGLRYQPRPRLQISLTVGQAIALAALDRHEAALEILRAALSEDVLPPEHRRQAIAAFQRTLQRLFDRQQARADHINALAYLSLAAELTPGDEPERELDLCEKLGRACQTAVPLLSDPQRQRACHEQAARSLERAADLVQIDEPRLAALLWEAAVEYDKAGRIGDARRVLERFAQGRSENPLMPQALLQLGHACEACGQPQEALRWYRRVIAEYPRLEETSRAKLRMAGVLISLGPERHADAERTLAELLEDGRVAPKAAVHRDALLELCELLHHQRRFAEAISRLHDFHTLYPDDPDRLRVEFMLADAHRLSGYALRDNPEAAPSASTAEEESRRRFREAEQLFAQLLNDLADQSQTNKALELYRRLGLFHRADCLFELNEPETLQAALALYQTAAARYDQTPAALTAQVQIANTHLRLANLTEAARALERARWLLRSIPDEAYAQGDGGDREEWSRFLSVVCSSDLFRDVFGDTP